MIKSVKISRNDGLIFCEVDDENIDENFSKSKEKIYKLFKDAKLEKIMVNLTIWNIQSIILLMKILFIL